jgi:hypothetical protein
MRKPNRVLKGLALSILALVFVPLTAALALLISIYLHPFSAWHFVQEKFLPPDLTLAWKHLDFDAHRTRGLSWNINASVTGLSVKKTSPHIIANFDKITLQSSFTFLVPKTAIVIHELKVLSTQPIIFIPTDSKTDSQSNPGEVVQQFLSQARRLQEGTFLEDVDVDLAEVQYGDSLHSPLLGSLKIHKSANSEIPLSFAVSVRHSGNTRNNSIQNVSLSGNAVLASEKRISATAQFELHGPNIDVTAPLKLSSDDNDVTLESFLKVRIKIGKKSISAKPFLQASLNSTRLQMELRTTVHGIPGPMPELRQLKISSTLPLSPSQPWYDSPVSFSASAPLDLYFVDQKMRKPVELGCHCRVPEVLQARLDGKVNLKPILESSSKESKVLDVALSIQSIKNKLFNIDLGAKLAVFKDSDRWLFKPALNSELIFYSFQGLRRFLDAKNIMIPAPLSTLEGPIALHMKAPITVEGDYNGNPLITCGGKFDADLVSKDQDIHLDGGLMIKANSDLSSVTVNVKTNIRDLQLELPPIDPIRGLPKFVSDSRIQLKPVISKGTPKFKIYFNFEIATAKPRSIRLLSKSADPFIPLSLDIIDRFDSGNSRSGFIQIEPFRIQYLRRKVEVDSLRISLKETPEGTYPIEGDFHVNQTDYKVMIHVAGNTRSPQIQLTSDPYLDNSDIISVLLYDRVTSQLAGGDAETSSNVEAAIADRAIGLFGLWAFAATPIRSFAYNPVTKVYSATVLLGNGVTAGVGTSLDQSASFEVRKRISNRWVLTASYAPGADQNEVGSIVLQWENRF